MQELNLDVSPFGTNDEITENIEYALSLGLQEFQPSLVVHDGTAVLVGSGPTVINFIDDIRREKEQGRTIISINGGHDLLMGHAICPDLFVTTDPRGMPQNFKHINPKTIYMLASRVNHEDFKTVLSQTQNVVLWHCDSAEHENELLKDKLRVGGPTTSGLRAIFLSYLMGFRKFNLYGYDSCITEDKRKRWDSGPMNDETATTDVIVGGRSFLCNMAMAQQAQEFQDIYEFMGDIKVTSFGDGLITAILKERKLNEEKRDWKGFSLDSGSAFYPAHEYAIEGGLNESIHRNRQQTTSSSSGTSPLHTKESLQAGSNNPVEDRPATYIETGIN